MGDNVYVLEPGQNEWSMIKRVTENPEQENAFFVFNISEIVESYSLLNRLLPRVHPHYAVKCNPYPLVLRTLATLGAGFDVASQAEIDSLVRIGVEQNRMIFANTFKRPSHFRHAANLGVNTLTFDSACELYKAKNIYPNANYVIRIKCDDRKDKIWITCGSKFGCDHATEAPELLHLAQRLNLNIIGVSFHAGCCVQPSERNIYRDAIAAAKTVFDYAATIGYNFTLLDIGGGFDNDEHFHEVANVINSALDTLFPDPNIRIISEPGRFCVFSSFTLSCNIINVKNVKRIEAKTGDEYSHNMYIINDGTYGCLKEYALIPNAELPTPFSKKEIRPEKYSSSIWGPTCDPRDKVAENLQLSKLECGDWLVFRNLGDYSLSMRSQFHEFDPPNILAVADQKTWNLLKDEPLFKNVFTFDFPQSLQSNKINQLGIYT